MSGSENGSGEQRPIQASPGRTIGSGRSASPAKRRAEDMDGGAGEQVQPPGSFVDDHQENGETDWDVEMKEMTSGNRAGESQETMVTNSMAKSNLASMPSSTFRIESPPAYPQEDNTAHTSKTPMYTTAETDWQCNHVEQLALKELDEGSRGVIVSRTWLDRVRSRSSQGLTSKSFPAEAREGPVGPLDNSDIVLENAFTEPYLRDPENAPFVPLKPGLAYEEDYLPFPHEAYEYICSKYGSKHANSIRRYAHNTAPPEATQANIQYEMYPPIITVRKLPQPGSESPAKAKSKGALSALKARKEQASRGQKPGEAPRLVTSKSEKPEKFLRRAKEAAGIPLARNVRVWRVKKAEDVSLDLPDNKQAGVLSPPTSRAVSPETSDIPKLIVDADVFSKMEIGVELEATDVQDEKHNENFHGSSTMELLGFFEDSTIILEEQTGGPAGGEFQSDFKKPKPSLLGNNNSGSKPGSTTTSGRTSPAPGMVTRGRARKDGKTRGTVGLSNLGNTCYMNSALQCIRSVEELAIFFMTAKFKEEINNDNPLGYHGAMANAYSTVIKGIYGTTASSTFSPNEFKRKLGTHQAMFSGYGQQDSQEFLSFLVDALHEDLNRIKKKPYIENPDSDDARIHDPNYIVELGETYRNNHKLRNDSVAMDLFSGFYKNTMECPSCDKISVTFDPYSLVTVQLPMEITLQHNVTYIPRCGRPVIHQLDIDKNWTIKALKEHLAKKHPGTNPNTLWMAEVYNHNIFKVFDDATTVAEASIATNDYIFIYELDQVPKNTPIKNYNASSFGRDSLNGVPKEGMDSEKADVFAVPIFSRTKPSAGGQHQKAMHPLYITVTREEAKDYDVILKKVLIAVANTTSRAILKEFDEDTKDSKSIEDLDVEADNNSSEDAAGVSDHSAQSEEGYVNISMDKSSQDTAMVNGDDETLQNVRDEKTYVPSNFMDPQYFLSPALREHLFEVKYTSSNDGNMFLSGMSGYSENNVWSMPERVKRYSRRSSVQSSTSEESTTSTASESQDQEITDDDRDNDNNGGIDDSPDIVLGGDSLSADGVEESDDELAGSNTAIMEPSQIDHTNGKSKRRGNKSNRRKGKQNGKGRSRNGPITYSKQDKARYGQGRGLGGQFAANRTPDPDTPYYIQIGEGIVLDWRPEAVDSLFAGDDNVVDDMRGHRYVDDNGKHGRIFFDPEQDARRQRREMRKKHGVDLEDCFEVTRRREILSEGNEWYCNRCKEMRQAAKTLEIWTIPDILVVHLKRFGGSRTLRDKVDMLVDYPVEGLDMNDKVGMKVEGVDYTYDLFAVDLHFGGLGGGHYTAYAKNFYDGDWYDYNDSMVHKISEDRIKSSAAYLLFYRRRSEKPLGPQELQDLVEAYRNPPASVEGAEDDGSGEGRLGGPTHSPHGSPSVLAGAAVAKNHRKGSSGSGGAGRGSSQTTRVTETSDDETAGNRGIASLHSGEASWGFDGLGNQVDQADEADTLLDNMSTGVEFDDRDSAVGSTSSFPDNETPNSRMENSPAGEQFIDVNSAGHFDDPDPIDVHLSEEQDKMD